MKRKKPARQQPVVSREILEQARRALVTDRARPAPKKCVVCGAECAPKLCWVCRRLKISAWAETDYQMPAQE